MTLVSGIALWYNVIPIQKGTGLIPYFPETIWKVFCTCQKLYVELLILCLQMRMKKKMRKCISYARQWKGGDPPKTGTILLVYSIPHFGAILIFHLCNVSKV